MMYKCDYCDKLFTSKKKLSDHERKVHPARERQDIPVRGQPVSPARDSATERPITPATERNVPIQELIIKRPIRDDAPESASYHCNDCGTTVEMGQEICPGCGERLVWDDVE